MKACLPQKYVTFCGKRAVFLVFTYFANICTIQEILLRMHPPQKNMWNNKQLKFYKNTTIKAYVHKFVQIDALELAEKTAQG